MSRQASIFVLATVVLGALLQHGFVQADDHFSRYVDDDGNIAFPQGFRDEMIHLGSWFVPEGGASGFHDVYTERESAAAFRRTGQFPDGATLIKELRSADSGNYTTGENVQFSTQGIKQWFVMIKDSEGRYAGNSLWGDGWGWALFMPTDRETNVATNYRTDCLGCHVPAKDSDWVFVEAYPTLTETD